MFAKDLRKTIRKYSSATIAEGFYDSELQMSAGNYAMNKLMSGSFFRGIPYHKTTVIGGQSGSGKSLVAATAAMNAQKADGAMVLWLDSEKASKEQWLKNVGLDTSEDAFLYVEVGTIQDVKKIIADTIKIMRSVDEEKRQKVVIVIDSYSFLMTETEFENSVKGDVVGDQGQHAKQIKALIKSITHLIPRLPIAVIGMVHSMDSGDKYKPDEILTGGRGLEYAASLVIAFTKSKLKAEGAEDNTILDEYDDKKQIAGINCICKIYKSRFAKPNERVTVQIPWGRGIDEFSGTFDLLLASKLITVPSVGWYAYSFRNGTDVKFRKKDFREHAIAIMSDIDSDDVPLSFEKDDTPEDFVPHDVDEDRGVEEA